MKFTNFGKKLFAFVAIALFGLALVACNKPNNGGNNGGNENNEQEQLKAQHQANVNAVLESIFFDETLLSEVKGNMTLVQANGKYPEVKIEWTSSEADIIAADGTVVRPSLDDPRAVDGKVEVTLTVTASQGEAKGTKTFKAYVLGEKKVSVNTIQAAKASFYTLMQEAGMKYSDKTSEMAVSVEFTGNVVAKISKGIFVNDGSGVVYVYGSSDVVVGDTVKVSGNLYAYYGLIEIGSNVSVEKVAAQEFAAPVFEETTVSEYTTALDAALDANGKIVDVDAFVPFSCGALKLYAKVEKGDKGSGDMYYLADPYTAQSVAIYHYATDDHAATLDALVGKYVYANVYAYDTHSALADRYRVIWDGSEMVEAEAPDTLTPAQQIESILSGLSVAKKTIENIDLGAVENVVWSLKAASDNAVLEGNTLKVTRPAFGSENAKVTVVATATVEGVSNSKEFEVEVVAEFNPTIEEISKFTAEGVYKFGFYQGNNLEYNYITGEMSGYYPATTTNPAKAADVKVVTVDGGYQILVGSKYLEIVQSGTYTNVVFSESASIAWAYDADLNTFTYALGDKTYYLGTYKTYNTLSASTVDKAATSFVGHLYTVEYEEEEQPEIPDLGVNEYKPGDNVVINAENLFAGVVSEKNSYADYNGNHAVDGINYYTENVLKSNQTAFNGYLQCKKQAGIIRNTNAYATALKTITFKFYNTYAEPNLPTIKAGATADALTEVTAVLTGGTPTGVYNGDYEVLEFTITYTLPEGCYFWEYSDSTSGAKYFSQIVLGF